MCCGIRQKKKASRRDTRENLVEVPTLSYIPQDFDSLHIVKVLYIIRLFLFGTTYKYKNQKKKIERSEHLAEINKEMCVFN